MRPRSAPTGDPVMGSANVKVITDTSFEEAVRRSEVPVLIDFHAVWCGPCKQMAPMIEAAADQYAGRLLVGKVDVDSEPITTMQLRVTAMPTLVLFIHGKEAWRQVGSLPKAKLEAVLAIHLAPAAVG